jgi:hypothetical protein
VSGMKKAFRNNPMKHVRKQIPKPGFDFKDKSNYNRKKKHKKGENENI